MITINSLLEIDKHLKNIDVVIFDLDDTLYSEKEYIKSGFRAIALKCHDKEVELILWDAFRKNKNPIDELIKVKKLNYSKQELLSIYRYHIPKISLYTDAKFILNNITKKTGVITDGEEERQNLKINALNLKVDKIIITDSLGGTKYRKPNPIAFKKMKEYFKVAYNRMAYIGDNIKKDFIAPNKLGMKCIYFKNKDGLYL